MAARASAVKKNRAGADSGYPLLLKINVRLGHGVKIKSNGWV
jgi:hypothetical protein